MHDPRSGDLIAALNHGHFGIKLHRSRDGGATWTEIAAPKYPEKPDGLQTEDAGRRRAGRRLVAEAGLGARAGRRGSAGRDLVRHAARRTFKSEDGGDSWALNRELWDDPRREQWFGGGADQPGIHSICVDPRDSQHVKIGVSCGGVWTTRDGGRQWSLTAKGMRADFMPPDKQFEENVQDPHMVAQCRSNPDVLWVQHHNGIFKSTDGAATWTELTGITPSSFGFAVAVHPHDPDTAWFVPGISDEKRCPVDGRVVVNRTRDGGKTFETITRGLPQQHAYDLVFRHALDVDRSRAARWSSDRRPDRCGSARTAAIRGTRCRPTCRRSMR